MRADELFETQGGKHAAQAYWNALSKLRAAWRDVFAEDIPTVGNRAMDAFEQALQIMKARLASDPSGGERLRDALDVDANEDIADVLLNRADVDDITPNAVKQAMREHCHKLGEGKHELTALLRPILDTVFANSGTRRPHVGANRHWPRLLQYLRELEEETDWSPSGRGIRLMNAGGRGPVASEPTDPRTLQVKIDPNYLPTANRG